MAEPCRCAPELAAGIPKHGCGWVDVDPTDLRRQADTAPAVEPKAESAPRPRAPDLEAVCMPCSEAWHDLSMLEDDEADFHQGLSADKF